MRGVAELIDTHPELCVTAGELRASGADIPPHVPDCAWAPRSALRFVEGSVVVEGVEGALPASRELNVKFDYVLTQPLRWTLFTVQAEP